MRDDELVRVEVLRLGVRLSVLEQADEHLDLGRSNAVNLRLPVPVPSDRLSELEPR